MQSDHPIFCTLGGGSSMTKQTILLQMKRDIDLVVRFKWTDGQLKLTVCSMSFGRMQIKLLELSGRKMASQFYFLRINNPQFL